MKQFSIYILIIGLVWGFCPTRHFGLLRTSHHGNNQLVNLKRSGAGFYCHALSDPVFMGFGSKTTDFERNEVVTDKPLASENFLEEEVHLLPPPQEGDESVSHKLEVDGPAVSMPELGPVIVNADGTLRRIENWTQMTKQEQASTIKMISRRNKKRLEALKELEEEEKASSNAQGVPVFREGSEAGSWDHP
jgi:hypothetical protein